MIEILLLPIFLVWFCMAFPVLAAIVGTIVWCAFHMVHDAIVAERGCVWCPVFERQMLVKGTRRRFITGVQFATLRRCERYDGHRIRCAKVCLAG